MSVPGYYTIVNEINNNPNLTQQEKDFLLDDARIMSKDGKLSGTERDFIRGQIAMFASPGDGATSGPVTPPPPPPPPSSMPPMAPTPTPPPPTNTTAPIFNAPPPVPYTPSYYYAPSSYSAPAAPVYTAPAGIKQAGPDIIIFDEEIDPDFLTQMFFQEFGGTELINISRHDLINGENVSYNPIINLSELRQSFNPNNIIAIGAFQEVPTKYGIDLFTRGVIGAYFDENANLVIEIDSIRQDESIEVEIASDGTINRIEL